jgi:ABC-type molybdate transport system substrate-binding protein
MRSGIDVEGDIDLSARCSAATVGLMLLLAQPAVRAAELQVWTARVGATVLAEIGSEFERTTGHTLKLSVDLPDPFLQRIKAGEQFDVLISTAGPIDALIKEGRLAQETRATFARSGIGVEVRKGVQARSARCEVSCLSANRQRRVPARLVRAHGNRREHQGESDAARDRRRF